MGFLLKIDYFIESEKVFFKVGNKILVYGDMFFCSGLYMYIFWNRYNRYVILKFYWIYKYLSISSVIKCY